MNPSLSASLKFRAIRITIAVRYQTQAQAPVVQKNTNDCVNTFTDSSGMTAKNDETTLSTAADNAELEVSYSEESGHKSEKSQVLR